VSIKASEVLQKLQKERIFLRKNKPIPAYSAYSKIGLRKKYTLFFKKERPNSYPKKGKIPCIYKIGWLLGHPSSLPKLIFKYPHSINSTPLNKTQNNLRVILKNKNYKLPLNQIS